MDGWLDGWLVGWLVGWLDGWLVGSQLGWVGGSPQECDVKSVSECALPVEVSQSGRTLTDTFM